MVVLRPHLKKLGLELLKSNYRPLSNLSLVSKLMEEAVLEQCNQHCVLSDNTPTCQSDYKENHSCEMVLLKIINDALWSMENQNFMIQVLINLSAAFDTVDHDKLVEVLEKCFGVESPAVNWFSSYLSPRYFKVCFINIYLESETFTFSIPQGSLSGPAYLNTYSSTISMIIPQSSEISAFVDDHSLFKTFIQNLEGWQGLDINDLENCLVKVGTWMDTNILKMNTSKTELILRGNNQQLAKCNTQNIKIITDTVKHSQVMRYIGAWIDENLTFMTHVGKNARW